MLNFLFVLNVVYFNIVYYYFLKKNSKVINIATFTVIGRAGGLARYMKTIQES